MAINVSVQQYNGRLLPDIILLTQCYCHRGTPLNTMKSFFLYLQPMIPPKQVFYKKFFSIRRVTRRQVVRQFTSSDTDQCQNGSSLLHIIESNLDRLGL